MITVKNHTEEQIEHFRTTMNPANPEFLSIINRDYDLMMRDAIIVAQFLEILYPEEEIVVFERWRIDNQKFNKDGSIWTFDVYVKNHSGAEVYLSWFGDTQRTGVSARVRNRTELGTRMFIGAK